MNRFSKGLFLLGLSTLTVAAVSFAKTNKGNWDILKIKGNTVYFRNGESLKTGLHDVKYIGKIQLKNNSPLYIFSGADCENCDEQNSIFVFSPAEKNKTVTPEYAPYDFPGREFSNEDSSLVYQSRMFYGQVLPNVTNGIIWYQDMLTDDGVYQRSVYLIKVVNNKISEQLILDNIPSIDDTLKMVAANKCQEVKGVDTLTEL
jgi:hypothetical protein